MAYKLRIRLRCASPKISIRSRHSRRTVPIRRSAYPFCQGDLGEIGRSRIPMALSRDVKTCHGADVQGKASVICRASHSAVGCRVTSNHSNCRRPWLRTRNANNRSKVSVGTTHISIAAITSMWFRRNVLQDCEGGLRPRTMYLKTVDWGDFEPQHQQFAMDPGRTPERILF